MDFDLARLFINREYEEDKTNEYTKSNTKKGKEDNRQKITEVEDQWKKFGKWVRSRRKMLEKSQEACSLEAGMATSTWSNIENGQISARMKVKTLLGISKALELDLKIDSKNDFPKDEDLSVKGSAELLCAAIEKLRKSAQLSVDADKYLTEILKRLLG